MSHSRVSYKYDTSYSCCERSFLYVFEFYTCVVFDSEVMKYTHTQTYTHVIYKTRKDFVFIYFS